MLNKTMALDTNMIDYERKLHGTVLVVDDSVPAAQYIAEAVSGDGHQVTTVHSGNEALKCIDEKIPDIILLDVVMKDLDGYTVCKKIREIEQCAMTKIIMVSGEIELENRITGYKVGADDYLTKPFQNEELHAKLQVFLRLQAAENELVKINQNLHEQVVARTEQLLHAEKTAALGRHAAGIVHNLNNPLQTILGCSQLLQGRESNKLYVDMLVESAVEMQKIITTILDTGSREHREDFTEIDINEVIEKELKLFQSNLHFKNNIATTYQPGAIPRVQGLYVHYTQVIGNLLKNAIDALMESKNPAIKITTATSDDYVIIKIKDNGTGIDEETLPHIFEPFFTTKPLQAKPGQPAGTGLGLPFCKEMIESYQGRIEVSSQPGEGTEFTLRYPIPASVKAS